MIKIPEPAAVESTYGCTAKGLYQHHKYHPARWQDERDDDEEELPEREEPEPIHTTH